MTFFMLPNGRLQFLCFACNMPPLSLCPSCSSRFCQPSLGACPWYKYCHSVHYCTETFFSSSKPPGLPSCTNVLLRTENMQSNGICFMPASLMDMVQLWNTHLSLFVQFSRLLFLYHKTLISLRYSALYLASLLLNLN